jgi:hypothetical protein
VNLVVDHLTRMRGDRICVALLDEATGDRYRPVLSGGQHWTRGDTMFRLGTVFESLIGPSHQGRRPMSEDWWVTRSGLKSRGQLDDTALWALISQYAVRSLDVAFGSSLRHTGAKCWVEPGEGDRSLAAMRVKGASLICQQTKLTLELDDASRGAIRLSVTDLRLWRADGTIDRSRATVLARVLSQLGDAVVSLGLAREFEGRHWLQANNIHLPAGALDHPVFWGA